MDVDNNNFDAEYYFDHIMDYSPEEQQMDTYLGWSNYDIVEDI